MGYVDSKNGRYPMERKESRKMELFNFLFSIRFLFIFVFAFFLGVVATISGITVLGLFISDKSVINTVNSSDAIAIANTYIVLTTLLFVMTTVIITIYTFWFSKWFLREKTKEIKENIHIIADEMSKNGAIRSIFIEQIFKDGNLNEELKNRILIIAEEEINDKIKNSLNVSLNLRDNGSVKDAN